MAVKGNLTPEITAAIAARLEQQAIELYDIEYRRESSGLVLRIFIDTVGVVDTDTCATATRAIKGWVDEQDDLDYDYMEVSSPGIDRILKQDSDFKKYKGSRVLIKTSQPVEGQKKFIGTLNAFNPQTLSIDIEDKMLLLNRDIITIVRLYPDI